MSRLRIRRIALVVLFGGVLLLPGAVWMAADIGRGAADTVPVERRDLVSGVDLEGVVEAVDPATLGPPTVTGLWNYQVSFMIPEGTEVRTGQPVLAFDANELDRRLRQREADRESAATEIDKRRTDLAKQRAQVELQLAQAEARLRRTELQLETPEELMASNELAKQRIDRDLARAEIDHLKERLTLLDRQADAELGMLEERRRAAAARVGAIREDMERMRLKAPRSGIVIYEADWQGEKVKVGDEVWMGRTVLQIPDLERLRGAGTVSEAELAAISVDQAVRFRLDAHPDVRFTGRIERIGRTVQRRSPNDPRRVVRVEIAFDQADPERLRPGLRFQGEVETQRLEQVLSLPADTVVSTPEGPTVYRKRRFGVEAVRPELGRVAGGRVEVLDGLSEGERVLLEAPERVREGGA